MPITVKGKRHQQTGGLTAGQSGMHARWNDSDGYFSTAVPVEVSDTGPREICKNWFILISICFLQKMHIYWKMINSALIFKIFFFLLVPPALRKLEDSMLRKRRMGTAALWSYTKPLQTSLVVMFGWTSVVQYSLALYKEYPFKTYCALQSTIKVNHCKWCSEEQYDAIC